jgi:Zn-dependent peptidase ImmA (M78 family)
MTAANANAATAVAQVARANLGLSLQGPIRDIVALVEAPPERVPVTIAALPETLAGAFLKVRSRPFILLNGNNHPTRQRFTLAHEFGHWKLGHGEVADGPLSLTSATNTPDETAANQFAAEFLAPLPAVHAWLQTLGTPDVDLSIVVRFAVEFGVSPWVARYRFHQAGCVSDIQGRKLDEGLANGMHRQLILLLGLREHQDTITEAKASLPRVPRELREHAYRGYANGLLSVERLAQLLRQDPKSVEAELSEHGVVQAAPEEERDW